MVKFYSKPNCVKCTATLRQLKKQGTEFQYIDVTEDDEAYAYLESLGVKAMPYVETDTDSWSDFRPDKIKSLIV